MRIGELAKRTGVSRDTIRHYLDLGLITATRDPHNGYQEFSSATARRLQFVRVARSLGFQLDEILHIMGKADTGHSPCADVRDMIQQRLAQTRERIAELQALCVRMQDAIDQWDLMPDGEPTGHSICRLIESQQQGSQS